ncbi:unnamed protein product [Rotaria sp. Silwood1]|nr:unnamed protein product [Rotaria sp. Silwood1]CAF1654036.1 unnamed protein product [Rotaria sp. Silwood1]
MFTRLQLGEHPDYQSRDTHNELHLQETYFPNPIRCIALSIALTYYFRLPTKEDNLQGNDKKLPAREQLTKLVGQAMPHFDYIVQNELERFVNTDNIVIPQGIAMNQAFVFLDEASLPNEKKMVLKVLHPYLDERKVAWLMQIE